MTTRAQLQQHLQDTGRYAGTVDGLWGRLTEAGILLIATDGPDTPVSKEDFVVAAQRLKVQPAAIEAFWKTEANGYGFEGGRDKILPEPHRFSKNTGHRFDKTNPTISYPVWGTRPYPRTQDARYDQWLAMIRLDVDAGFKSTSYGAPQIMGENFAECGYSSPMLFAEAMARDERTQLDAFCAFVSNAGILPDLRRVSRDIRTIQPVVKRYNGTAYAKNKYDTRYLANFIAAGGQ